MCEEADGTCPVWQRIKRVARKDHTCYGCDVRIKPGETYYKTSTLFDGRWSNWKHCERCDALMSAIEKQYRDAGDYGMAIDPRFACGISWEDAFGEQPEWVQEFAFWRPGDPLPQPPTSRTNSR